MPTSSQKKAYLDTTILTDILLKPGPPAERARRTLARFESSQLPVYAIKEFKAGPLANFVWMHNKLVFYTLEGAITALHALSRTPQRYKTATAIEALRTAADYEEGVTLGSLVEKYGGKADMNEVIRDRWRLALKTAILKAWARRRHVAHQTVQPLECYKEVAPYENRKIIELRPTRCKPQSECCLATQFKAAIPQLEALKKANDSQAERAEVRRRSKALRSLIRTPKRPMSEECCRSLGDVVFAFFCPEDAVLLTTNVRDHAPLAEALGKSVLAPEKL